MDGYGWLKMGEMDGMVEIVPQFALSFGATYTNYILGYFVLSQAIPGYLRLSRAIFGSLEHFYQD